jgi:hypothetical protein
MKNANFKLLILSLFTLSFTAFSFSQNIQQSAILAKDSTPKKADSIPNYWTHKAVIGINLGELLDINPYVGAGTSRIGIGGGLNYKTNYKKNLFSWTNEFILDLSVQRLGSGLITAGSNEKIPFEKALDILSYNSNVSLAMKPKLPWFYSFEFEFRSQLLASYLDSATEKIYLKELKVGTYNTKEVSRLFSPALLVFGPGVKYAKDKMFYAFITPLSLKFLIIGDQNIANLGIHGTHLKKGSKTEYETFKTGLDAELKTGYANTFYKKLNLNTELALFSDYLDHPENIDVVWKNSFGVEIVQGINLILKCDLYYDNDKLNSISNSNAVGGVQGFGKRLNVIEQLLLTYSQNF